MESLNIYRKSSYVIPVCLDNKEGKYMLVHGYTGALDLVPESVASLFEEERIHDPLPNKLSEDVWNFLLKRGYITKKTEEEEHILMNKIAHSLHLYSKNNKKRFYFIVNYNCNFRCPYCFENVISNKGKNWSQQIMTEEMVDKAFDSMLLIEPDRNKHLKEIVLYGGEPLMDTNVPIVNYIVNKGINLGYSFHAISNGYDLNLFENLLGEGKIEKIQITLDGDKKYHDSRRFHYKKGASYDKIIDNILLALDRNVRISVRSNIDGNNIDSIQKMMAHFEELHLFENDLFSFYPALLKDNENNLLDLPNKKHIAYLASDNFEDQIYQMGGIRNSLSPLFFNALKNKRPMPLHASHCGANTGIYILDPEGCLYCCLETVGIAKHIIGHFNGKEISWTSQYDLWKGRSVDVMYPCNKCRYALLCGGGCAAKVMNQNVKDPYCDNFPIIFAINAKKAYRNYCMQ